jgi:hypothetical protein
MRLLEKDRERRYADAGALLEDLLQRQSTTGALPFPIQGLRAAIAAACLGAIAVGAALMLRPSPSESGNAVIVAGFDAGTWARVAAELERGAHLRVLRKTVDGPVTPDTTKRLCRAAGASILV